MTNAAAGKLGFPLADQRIFYKNTAIFGMPRTD